MSDFNLEKFLQEQKGKIEADNHFKKNLRSEILKLAQKQKVRKEPFMKRFLIKNLTVALTGALVLVVLIVVATHYQTNSGTKLASNVAAHEGFGKLPALAQATGMGGGGGNTQAASPEAAPATNTTGDSKATSSIAFGRGGGGGVASMPCLKGDGSYCGGDEYLPPVITYSFSGDLPEVPSEMMVYRDGKVSVDSNLTKFLNKLAKVPFVKNLSGGTFQNLSFTTDDGQTSYGFDQSGRFNVWKNDPSAYSNQANSTPPDDQLISIANNYLQNQGFDLSNLGQPVVDHSWKIYIAANKAEAKVAADRTIWNPQTINVNYPGTLNNQTMVNWSGAIDPEISVTVSIVKNEVIGLNGRFDIPRDESLYPTRTGDEIKNEVLKGGLNPLWGYANYQKFTPEQEAKRAHFDVVFDSVNLGYIQQYKYDQSAGTSQAYWIPVYAFHGTYKDAADQTQEYSTIVPAIQSDLFDNNNGVVTPMTTDVAPAPDTAPSVSTGSAPAGSTTTVEPSPAK